MLKKSIIVLLCLVLAIKITAGGRPLPPGNAGDNIALDKPYTFSSVPNYWGSCTDSGDEIQLTDGVYTNGSRLWSELGTVGWYGAGNTTITIDLGEVQPIQGVSFNTAGGISDVQWPTAINMSASNDGINYYNIGELTSISNSQHNDAPVYGTYAVHRYWTDTLLATHGRFVRFQVVQSPYTFVDEIEIYRGPNTLLGQNIALGCSYTLTPPNYFLSTDADDIIQLTDGVYSNHNRIWSDVLSVGWFSCTESYYPWVDITIDLGSKQAISGMSFNTAAGVADVDWPTSIMVLVSDDDINYYYAGEVISLSSEHGQPWPSGYTVHSYWTDRLATSGRYVKIIPAVNKYYLFVDEIEIYGGNSGMLLAPSRGAVVSLDQTSLAALVKKSTIRAGISRRIVLDAQEVQLQADEEATLTQQTRDQIGDLLETSIDEAVYIPDFVSDTFKAVLPLNSSHARVFEALKTLWQAQGMTDLIAWDTDSQLDFLDITQSPGSLTGINVTMMQREYRAGAFNLSNASDNDLDVVLNIQGLPGGTNPSYITVHEAAWTDTRSGVPIVAALPEAEFDNGYIINIPAGMTRQVWLTFHPTVTNPGTYTGTIVVNGGSAGTVNVPVQFKLSTIGFPEDPTLSLGGFDYTDSYTCHYNWMTQNKSLFVNNLVSYLREHFVDTTWGVAASMPNPVDFTKFDAWAALWPGVRSYRVYLYATETFNGYQMGTVEFNQAVASWLNAYVAHWQGMGLNLSQFALHILDEPGSTEDSNIITAWSNAIKAAQPDIKLWTNPVFADPADGISMFQSVDILSPNRPNFIEADEAYRDVYRQQFTAGKTLNFYSCRGPVSKNDPYSYYRLQAWTCWDEGATAMHYWVFGDSGGSPWNEYQQYSNYTPFYIDDTTTIVSGKQMEAVREGVEDYEYLVMLKERIAELETGANPPPLTAARALLDNAAGDVLNAVGAGGLKWLDEKDATLADQKRIEILNMLESLEPQSGDNIAASKPYTLSVAPNYWGGCTDPDDIIQLTDTFYTNSVKLWTAPGAVGWYNAGTVTITIDLGSVQPIRGVSFNTAAGSGGVQWPSAINMSVSNDAVNYSDIGELVSISNNEHNDAPSSTVYSVHRYWTDQLSAYGRFMKITVTGIPYIFADEIEIYKN